MMYEIDPVLWNAHRERWKANSRRTDHVNEHEMRQAVENLYAEAGLRKPAVLFVPSPLTAALVYTAIVARRGLSYSQEPIYKIRRAMEEVEQDLASLHVNLRKLYYHLLRIIQVSIEDVINRQIRMEIYHALRTSSPFEWPSDGIRCAVNKAISELKIAGVSAHLQWYKKIWQRCAYHDDQKYTSAEELILYSLYKNKPNIWNYSSDPGNLRPKSVVVSSFIRDTLGIASAHFAKFATWEACTRFGGFRIFR